MPDHDLQQQQTSEARTPLALQRARHALEKVEQLEARIAGRSNAERNKEIGNYVNYTKGLPANILRSGLGQAMAMEKAGAKSDKGHGLLYAHIDDWLTAGWANSPYRNQSGRLLQAIVAGNQDSYVRAQAEALAYLEWLKKFAVAFLSEEEPAAETAPPSEPMDLPGEAA